MKFHIEQINEQGQRKNNEDSVMAMPERNLFVVCDGVGGNDKGEVASAKACEAIQQYFTANIKGASSQADINKAVISAEQTLDRHITAHPESAGMATTLTLVHLHGNKATAAHIGDSRIYQIRDGKILYKSFDHSLVNELVASGNITEEEARVHPKKNMITRALQSGSQPARADVKIIDDVQAGDYFMLCTDGIIETIDDQYICHVLVSGADLETVAKVIKDACQQHSRDNFSTILFRVDELDSVVENDDLTVDRVSHVPPPKIAAKPQEPVKKSGGARIVVYVIVFLLLGIGGYYAWTKYMKSQQEPAHKSVKIIQTVAPVKQAPAHKRLPYLVVGAKVDGYAVVKDSAGKWGYINAKDSLVISPQYDTAFDFKDHVAVVETKDKKWTFIRTNGVMLTHDLYDSVRNFSGGMAAVKYKKWGFIDRSGKQAVGFSYDSVHDFLNNQATVTQDGKQITIDPNGKPVTGK